MSDIKKTSGKLIDFTNDVNVLANRIKAVLSEMTHDDAPGVIDDVKLMRRLLEAAHTARQQMCMFAQVETEAYIKAAKLRASATSRRDQNILYWIRELTEKEQACLVRGAADGYTIEYFYEEHMKGERIQKQKERATDYLRHSVDTFSRDGEVTISSDQCFDYMGGQNWSMKSLMADAITSETRTQLLKSGGVCVGDGRYINTTHRDFPKTATKAIQTRARQIIADVKSLQQLVGCLKKIPDVDDLSLAFGVDEVEDMVLALFVEVGILAEPSNGNERTPRVSEQVKSVVAEVVA